jgi:hypothetical protein
MVRIRGSEGFVCLIGGFGSLVHDVCRCGRARLGLSCFGRWAFARAEGGLMDVGSGQEIDEPLIDDPGA